MIQNLRYALFCGIIAALVCMSAIAQGAPPLPESASRRLLNDLQVTIAPAPIVGAPTVGAPTMGDDMTIGLVVRYGAAFDPEAKGGLANLVSRMFLRAVGDQAKKDIQDELANLGATIEIKCDWDGFRFLLRGKSSTYERLLLLLYQVVGEAKFEEADFAEAKQSILQDLKKPADPDKRIRAQFDSVLFGGTTYGKPLEGTPVSVAGITLGDVWYFYRKHFSPGQAALQIVGNVPASLALQKASRVWGVWVRADDVPFTFVQPRKPAGRQIFLDDDPNAPTAQFIIGNLFPPREEPAYVNALLAARILQQRLTALLPTSLLTGGSEGRRMASPFYVQGQAAVDQAVGQIQKIEDAAEKMKQDIVSKEELSAAQKQMIEEFNRGLSSTDGLCNLLLDAELYRLGSNYAVLFPDQIRRCDEASVKQAANDWIFPGGEVLLIRVPMEAAKPSIAPLGSFQKLPR
jgi:zinc protease